MAFGDLKVNGQLIGQSTSPGTGISAGGSGCTVAVGDLIVANYGWRGGVGITLSDNLGNFYFPLANPTLGANAEINAWYSYVDVAGSLTTVTAAHSSSTGDAAFSVAVFEGPFDPWTCDVDGLTSADSTTPYTTSGTGGLSQADELIVGFQAQGNGAGSNGATSPYSLGAQTTTGTGANTASSCVIYHLVSSTAGETPEITSSVSTSGATKAASFRKARTASAGDPIGYFFFRGTSTTSNVLQGTNPTVAVGDLVYGNCWNVGSSNLTGSVTDNLGNTYTKVTGTTSGGASNTLFYSIVTNAGSLTSITAVTSAGQNTNISAVVYKGNITAIDANPAPATSASQSQITAPATGTLAQSSELVLAFLCVDTANTRITAVNYPLSISLGASGVTCAFQHQLVSSTTSVNNLVFNINPAQTGDVVGTTTFKVSAAATAWAGNATLNGAGNLSASVKGNFNIAETLPGVGSLSAGTIANSQIAARFSGAGNLSALASKLISTQLGKQVESSFQKAVSASTGPGYVDWNGFEFRQAIENTAGKDGTRVRVKFTSGSVQGLTVDHASIGIYASGGHGGFGDPPNMVATPTQLTFNGGSPGFTIGTNTTITSDWISLSFLSSDRFVVDWQIPSSAAGNAGFSVAFNAPDPQFAYVASIGSNDYLNATAIGSFGFQEASWFSVLGIDAEGMPAGKMAVAARQNMLAAAQFGGIGSLSVDAKNNKIGAATFAGSGNFQASVSIRGAISALFGGIGVLSVDTTQISGQGQVQQAAATFNGAGNLSVDTQNSKTAQVTFNGAGNLSANANLQLTASTIFGGAGNLSVDSSKSKTLSATFQGAGSLSELANISMQAAATFNGAGSLSAFANLQMQIAVTYNGAGNLSVDSSKSKTLAATFNGSGSLSAFANLSMQIAATFNGAGNLSAFATITGAVNTWSGEATFNGAGNLSAAMSQVMAGLATFNGAGNLFVDSSKSKTIAATFNGSGSLSAYSNLQMQIAVTYSGIGNLSVDSSKSTSVAATFNGTGSLSALANLSMQIAATYNGAGSLSAFATITGAVNAWPGEARFAGSGVLSAATLQTMAGQATFNGAGNLSAAMLQVLLAQATFNGAGNLFVDTSKSKSIAATFNGSGSLSAYANLQMQVAVTYSGAGNLSVNSSHSKSVAATFNGAGNLSVDSSHSKSVAATFNGVGSLSSYANLSMQIAATYNGAGNLSSFATITGAVNAWPGEARFIGSSILSAATLQTMAGLATFNGASNLSIATNQIMQAAARYNGSGVLSVDVIKLAKQLVATFNGSGLLSVSTFLQQAALATFNGAGNFSIQVLAGYAGSVRFTGTGNLIVSVAQNNTASAKFTGLGNLSILLNQSGNIFARFQGAGAFSSNIIQFVAGVQTADATFAGQGLLSVNILKFGPRHVKSKHSQRSNEATDIRSNLSTAKRMRS
jgi:hypothetical protein